MADTPKKTKKSDGTFTEITSARTDLTMVKKVETLSSNTVEWEDEFKGLYGTALAQGAIQPPYNLLVLQELVHRNNALQPCIAAMKTNIDGTGYAIEPIEGATVSDAELAKVKSFFDEPWPGESFMTLRKKIRDDIESTGNGYIEVIRNLVGEVMLMRHVDSKSIRMMQLGPAQAVTRTINRNGEPFNITVALRERAYIQRIGTVKVYFKEFGASRDINMNDGVFAEAGQIVAADERGTEILHFIAHEDSRTPYGVPRWVSQMPSVLGSRQAEEFNLNYFLDGGIPPIMIILQGGTMSGETKKHLERYFSGQAKNKHRAVVLEADPTGGSIDKPGAARVTVERFGSDKQSDAMFVNYDEGCEKKIRRSFRLPPILVGKADDYSFATAFASYMVAEAQVFQPEREAFDEVITLKLLPELSAEASKMQFRSLPLQPQDIQNQLQGLTMAIANKLITNGELGSKLNEMLGLSLEIDESIADNVVGTNYKPGEAPIDLGFGMDENGDPLKGTPFADPANSNDPNAEDDGSEDVPKPKGRPVTGLKYARTVKSHGEVIAVVAAEVAGMVKANKTGTARYRKFMESTVAKMNPFDRELFKVALAVEMFSLPQIAQESTSILLDEATSTLAGKPTDDA